MATGDTNKERRAEDIRLQIEREYENKDRIVAERLSFSDELVHSVMAGDAERVEEIKLRISAVREEMDASYARIRELSSRLEALLASSSRG